MKTLSLFRSAFSTARQRYSYLGITALVMAAAVFLYYFLFLASRGEELDQRYYRAVNRISQNFTDRLNTFTNMADAQSAAAANSLKYEIEDAWSDTTRVRELRRNPEGIIDELQNYEFIKGYIGEQLVVSSAKIGVQEKWVKEASAINIRKATNTDSLLVINVRKPFKALDTNAVAIIDYTLPIGAAIRPVLRDDIFERYIVTRDGEVVYESTPTGLQKIILDSTSMHAPVNSGSDVKTMLINGLRFRMYSVGFPLEQDHEWAVVGLKSADKFAAEQKAIPRNYLFSVFIIVLFLVLSVPFIKSLIMSRTEGLGATDVVFSAVSLCMATSVCVILVFNGYLGNDLDQREQDTQLADLSYNVEQHLVTELKAVTSELKAYTNYTLEHFREMVDGDADNVLAAYEPLIYTQYNDMFEVDVEGFTNFNLHPTSLSYNVSERRYFREMVEGHCMNHPEVGAPFYLDAVITWNEQEFRALISERLPDSLRNLYEIEEAVMSTRLQSLSDPVIPDGTGFMVFDGKGNIYFHSDSVRSLNENIFQECGEDPLLLASVTGRTANYTDVDYSGHSSRMYVRPLENLPYFIAVYSYNGPRNAAQGQVFGSALSLQTMLFFVYLLMIFAGFVLIRRRSRLYVPFFSFSAFIPDVKGGQRYMAAVLFTVLQSILLITAATLIKESLGVIMLFFVAAPYIVLFNSILLSAPTFQQYMDGEKRKFVWVFAVAIVITNSIAFSVVDIWWLLLLLQLVFIAVYWFIIEGMYRKNQAEGRLSAWLTRISYRRAYTLLIYVLVVEICVIPAVNFSIVAYNKEKEINVRIFQLDLLGKLNKEEQSFTQAKQSGRALGYYYTDFYTTSAVDDKIGFDPRLGADTVFDAYAALLRSAIQSYGEQYNVLKYGASDALWKWGYRSKNFLVLQGKNSSGCKDNRNISLASAVPVFHFPFFGNTGWEHVLRFWTLLLLAVIILHFVMRFFVGKLFLHEKYSRRRSMRFDETFFEKIEPGYKAYVTGMPSAGKSAYFTAMCKDLPHVYYVDFVKLDKEQISEMLTGIIKSGPGVVLLDHFEHNMTDPADSDFKLEVVEQLVANKEKKVIIISSLQPVVFLNILEETGAAEPENKASYDRRYERWSRALAAFYDFIFPLSGYDSSASPLSHQFTDESGNRIPVNDEFSLLRQVEKECDHGVFLRCIGMELYRELLNRGETRSESNIDLFLRKREEIIIRTQRLAENYYRSIWDHLTIEEQFVIYDLAQDGLVNSKNFDIVEALIDKGLVIYTNKLRVMNRSFRNFILCTTGPGEIARLENRVRESGAWNKLKMPLILVVCSLLLFIVKSDNSRLFGYFSAFTALVPVVVGLFGYLSQARKKE